MDIIISENTKQKIIKHADLSYPNECCGILFGNRKNNDTLILTDVKETENNLDSGKEFEINPLEVYRAEKEYKEKNLELIGFYHSHPDKRAVLSEKDKRNMISGMVYIIVSVNGSGVKEAGIWMIIGPDSEIEEIRGVGL